MKTIGVDIRVLASGRLSGVEEYTEHVLAHMIARGGDIRWKLFSSGKTPLTHRAWMDHPSVRVYDFRRSNRLLWARTRLTGRPHLDALIGGADVFFFPHFLLGALSPHCKRVMTWHDLSYERMPHLLSWHRRLWHNLQMRPYAQAMMADRLIAVSSSTAVDLQELYGIDAARISTIHSGIDPTIRRASEPALGRWRAHRGLEQPFILAVGTREPRKNLPALIAAWDMVRRDDAFRSVALVIAGKPGWREHELDEAIARTRTPGDVRILADVDHTERPLLLSAASVLAYPSLMEGFGFPPLEAMACGTPVVASATSSILETVGDAGLLVDPYRVDSIADALGAILRDAGLRSRLVARGYDRARTFSWDSAAASTLDAILSVL